MNNQKKLVNINKIEFLLVKINTLKNIISKTITSSQKYKLYDILGANEVNVCISTLDTLFNDIKYELEKINTSKFNLIETTNKIQKIEDELLLIVKNFGTDSLADLIYLLFGDNYIDKIESDIIDKYNLLLNKAHPINYKILPWKPDTVPSNKKQILKTKIVEDNMICESGVLLDCFDFARTSKSFQTKVYGIKLCLHDYENRRTYLVACLVDDILISCVENLYLKNKFSELESNKPKDIEYENDHWQRFIESLTIKDILVYSVTELAQRFISILNQLILIKQKTITQVVKEFLSNELYAQRTTLIQLLIQGNHEDFQYLAYLLYDLLSNENNSSIDTLEQTLLYDSLPWNTKKFFKVAMKQTIQYTNILCNYDSDKIPLEQQICLLKASDSVKEKAILKLKEIKAKSEDTGSKARQYLDGLLKIPFSIMREEPCLNIVENNQQIFQNIIQKLDQNKDLLSETKIPDKQRYTNHEILRYIDYIKNNHISSLTILSCSILEACIKKIKKDDIITIVSILNNIIKTYKLPNNKIHYSNKKISQIQNDIIDFINTNANNFNVINNIWINIDKFITSNNPNNIVQLLTKDIYKLEKNISFISEYISKIKITLNSAVHGHDKAKRQVERIVGQWINGEKSGYCFGFEGPPGIGKCHIKDTPIMLSNGKIKMVQNITLEDKLMGDDSTPRNVLALGNGIEKMYRIEQIKGDDYIVNESHILSLKMTKAGKKGDKHQTILGRRYFKGDIVDICIKDYQSLPKYLQECLKGYKVGLDFSEKELDLEPYALGYWLGDGNSNTTIITTAEHEVVEYFNEYANKLGLELKQGIRSETTRHDYHYQIKTKTTKNISKENTFNNYLKNYNLINNKHIPEIYKCNSRENRLKLLAGLIDSDGYCNKVNNSLEITQKNKKLADDILFLVRSLGFCGTMKECTKSCMYKGEKRCGQYYRIIISGSGREEIPTLLERKRPKEHKQIKDGLNTGIRIVPLEEDKYYGFQIDGNSRFLLGDFTVTHNTSLAKRGLARCLKDENGVERPFAFIAIGGSANGSTLEGHNYTYVGSTWGRIVDILIESKCMNPIIFIDELDKISRTEHGKEIIGILTHLIDPTQNDTFQDKYFSGIDLDLSKVLFIFSYNDVDSIDRILLDRIHRIKFKNLAVEEKLVITNNYILPEIYKKMGLENVIDIDNNVIEYIISNYTKEPGVRKLKEILFEIIAEINLSELANINNNINYPIKITIEDIKYKYLKDRHEFKIKQIFNEHKIGLVSGLWANNYGQGGLLPIETKFLPSSTFLELKLTGMQGDVMKESMNVAKTVAWNLLSTKRQNELLEKFEKNKSFGIHIHVPEGATPKDGPSGGAAITTVIYSLLSDRKINRNFAMTGEICLQGRVTAIGGLDLKILGGIESGVTHFIYPKENDKDFKEFEENLKNKSLLNNIKFTMVSSISEVFDIIFVD
tara:strand:+ start:9412 stop:13749 length:4338 start_codon:yes stop_codon:yes gene_type:complete